VRSTTTEIDLDAAPVTADAVPRGRPRDVRADEAILAATFRQLVDVGYAALSIESIAAEAGVAKTTIYRRHPTKRELVIAALRAATPFEPPSADLPAREALERFVRTAVRMLIDSGAFRILGSFLIEDRRDPGLLATFREELLTPRRAMVEAMLQRGIERGEIRPDIDPLVVTEMVAGAVIGHHAILGQPGSDAWVRDLVDHVWRAIAADAATAPAGSADGTVDSGATPPGGRRRRRAT
jgi:AcrR family transcriptional regulator